MKLFTLKIKDVVFKVAVVDEEEEMKKGLSNKPALGTNKGMLFNFKESKKVTMNMGGMNYPIDMVFIGPDRKVIDVRTMRPGDAETSCGGCIYVLEVKSGACKGMEGEKVRLTADLADKLGLAVEKKEEAPDQEATHSAGPGINIIIKIDASGLGKVFKKGGAIKIYEEHVKAKEKAMQVLDDKGRVLMNIVGGERIFSIKHTEELVDLAKKIDSGEVDEAILGKRMAEIIDIQNTQEPEYV